MNFAFMSASDRFLLFTVFFSDSYWAMAKLHSFAKIGLSVGLCGFANVCNVRLQKFSKM